MSPLARAIRHQVGEYLAGRLSLQELDGWLWSATSDIEDIDDPGARDLTYEIILRVAEYSRGDRTETEVKDVLREAVAPPVAAVAR